MEKNSYQDLNVWQKSIELVIEIYRLVKCLPKEELYALSDQMRRAAVSIPSNIAEGQQRKSVKEFTNYLSISRGSIAELETQLIICEKLGYLTEKQAEKPLFMCKEIGKMINGLMKSINC